MIEPQLTGLYGKRKKARSIKGHGKSGQGKIWLPAEVTSAVVVVWLGVHFAMTLGEGDRV